MMNVLLDGSNFNEAWAYDRFSEFIDKTTRITIFPFAFHEDWVKDKYEWHECYDKSVGRFYKALVNPFLHFGVSENNIVLINYFENSKSDLLEILKNTDLIYFNGGFPEQTIRRLIELDMLDAVNAFKGVVMGWSAGASMQSYEYFIAPDKYYDVYSRHHGLSHIHDFAVQVHYSGEPVQIESMTKFIKETHLRVFTLERDSAVIVDDGKIELVGNAKEFVLIEENLCDLKK